jgi:hypothetical protein
LFTNFNILSNDTVDNSNTIFPMSAFASKTSIYASNVASTDPWIRANNSIYTVCNVVIGQSNATINTPFNVSVDATFSSNVLVRGSVSNALGVAPTPGNLIRTLVITSSTIYTPISGANDIRVQLMGGGGGGGGVGTGNGRYGSGGGAGGYGWVYLSNIGPSTNITVTIGAGGKGGTGAPSVTNGGTGGTTSFVTPSTTLSVTGGAGGITDTSTNNINGGLGGSTFTGPFTLIAAGQAGGPGFTSYSGGGGNTLWGAGGQAISLSANAPGAAALGFGSGGGGAFSVTSAAQNGGAGAPGIIIVEEYT